MEKWKKNGRIVPISTLEMLYNFSKNLGQKDVCLEHQLQMQFRVQYVPFRIHFYA